MSKYPSMGPKKRKSRLRTLYCNLGLFCFYCGQAVLLKTSRETDPNLATLDHIIPGSQGGPASLDNLLLSCYRCNFARADMAYEEYLSYIRQSYTIQQNEELDVRITQHKEFIEFYNEQVAINPHFHPHRLYELRK